MSVDRHGQRLSARRSRLSQNEDDFRDSVCGGRCAGRRFLETALLQHTYRPGVVCGSMSVEGSLLHLINEQRESLRSDATAPESGADPVAD